MITTDEIYDISQLPTDILSYSNDQFFDFIKKYVGAVECEILEKQAIKNVRLLLHIKDPFSLFDVNCEDLVDLKRRACFIYPNTNEYVVRPGIKYNIEHVTELLRKFQQNFNKVNNNDTNLSNITTTCSQANEQLATLLKNLNDFVNNSREQNEQQPFVLAFLEGIIKNLSRPKNNYKYNEYVQRFATALYILAGSNTYEFIRINLPGALPSISTLEQYNKNIDLKMNECQFRFDRLKEHLDTINSKFVFLSEDCSSVVSKISYDVSTDSFVGFIPSLHKGIPQTSSYQTDDFEQLQEWFMTIDKSSLINVHMVEPLLPLLTTTTVTMPPQPSKSRPFLLAAYGTDTKSVAIDILRRWVYIYEQCKLNNIRIIGYSTDCDGKYLKAMRLTNG
ncbi:unnamed protein product, partial [Didymodactylos carnosus]